jgi:small-conductance mechanosensitive channel
LLRHLILPLFLAFALPTQGFAQVQVSPLAQASATIAQAEKDLRTIDHALDARVDADDRTTLRATAVAAQQGLSASESQLSDQLSLLDDRITGLGPVTAGVVEAPDIQRERQRLTHNRSAIDAAIKRARLSGVEAQQLIDEIDRSKAEQLNETLSTRVNSPLAPAFWSELLESLPRDLRRVGLFAAQGGEQVQARWRSGLPWQALLGLAFALALMFPVRIACRRLGQSYLVGSAPGHRIRRSLFALWKVLIGTLVPALAAYSLVQGLRWAGLFPANWDDLFDGFVAATGFSAFTASLAGAVLMRKQPSWRVAPISDETANQLRPLTWVLAMIAFASGLVDAFNRTIGASRTATTGWQMIEALVHLLWIAVALGALGRLRARRVEAEEAEGIAPGAGIAAMTLVAWALVIAALIALAAGYVALSLFVARVIIWAAVLGAALYLLLGTADDAAMLLFNRDSRLGVTLTRSIGVRGSVVDQLGVLVSAIARVILVLIAFGLLMSPFGGGAGLTSIFGRLGTLSQGFEVGGIAISPGAVIRAVVVFALGLAIVRAFTSWLEKRYLPATDLDGSARNSASLVARYVGIALVIIWALASLGIGIERIALLLSALSVGIGFGLQAITQNFVSGLILLAERPIKIGDWVRVGTDEGDVKRISVRSTEITLSDHSTLIVPNSELITKTVLNKTLSSPLGRIQIQFSVPLDTSVDTVRQIIVGIFAAETAVLDEPAPSAYIDSIALDRIAFNCFAHVASPRDVYRTRSNVLMALLRTFAAQGIDIGTLPQKLELHTSDPLPEAKAPPASD